LNQQGDPKKALELAAQGEKVHRVREDLSADSPTVYVV
jgi:hypothetical protein